MEARNGFRTPRGSRSAAKHGDENAPVMLHTRHVKRSDAPVTSSAITAQKAASSLGGGVMSGT
eukprot:1762255-Pyramimonas_sp.AAC.1